MESQLQLVRLSPPPARPAVADLANYLRGQGWLTAREISQCTGWNDRAIRELASESDLIVSAPGLPGYKHIEDCTSEEYHRYRHARLSQCDEMRKKVARTDARFFKRQS